PIFSSSQPARRVGQEMLRSHGVADRAQSIEVERLAQTGRLSRFREQTLPDGAAQFAVTFPLCLVEELVGGGLLRKLAMLAVIVEQVRSLVAGQGWLDHQ